MMYEEEVVIRDEFSRPFDHSKMAGPDQDILPFTISDGTQNGSSKRYSFTLFEMFVTAVVMLSTISGGFLEGYTSPAIPSLLENTDLSQNLTSSSALNFSLPSGLNDSQLLKQKDNSTTIGDAVLTTQTSKEAEEMFGNDTNDSLASALENGTVEEYEELPEPLPLMGKGVENATTTAPTPARSWSFHVTEEEGSWLASLLLLGGALGAVISPWCVRMGRRHAIILSALPRFLGWFLIILSSNVYSIYAGRFLCGISIGAVSSATSIYISEIAHPSLRGSLSCVAILGVNVGIFVASLLGTFLEWRGLAIAGAVSVVAYLFPFLCIPNSPSWLILQSRENEARTALRKLRGKSYCVEDELQQVISVSENVAKSKSSSWREVLSSRRTLLPLGLSLLVTAINRFSGYNAIITYCALFLHQAVPAVSQYWAAVSVCLVQIIATVGVMSLVDSWGRRKLLVASVSVMGLSLVVIAACETAVSVKGGGTWVAVVATMTYVGAYSMGVGPLTFVLLGELFPLDARDRATALVVVTNWALAFLVTKTYFSMEESVGLSGTCLVYASVCLVGVVSIFFLVPETKGRTLAEIEAHFTYPRGRLTWGRMANVGRLDQGVSGILENEGSLVDSYSTFH